MVRKRTRTSSTRRTYRKPYDSDENESDSDLDIDSPPESPPPKRYGLRQRKQPTFCEEFDYEDEDDLIANSQNSDDEEYNVEVDLIEAKENHVTRNNKTFPRRNSTRSSAISINALEVDDASMADGLIDFEDVIRADVVVNKQRVDYDNVINKNEISGEDNYSKYTAPIKEKGRRGRKPKARSFINETHIAAQGSSVQNSQEEDTNLEVQIDPLNFVHLDSEESNPPKSNGVRQEKDSISEKFLKDALAKNGTADITLGPSVVDEIEKYVPPELDAKEKEIVLSNEYLLGNSFDMSADEFLEKQAQNKNLVEEEEETVPLINFDDDSSSDDDVVIIEKKPEIIVLDDD